MKKIKIYSKKHGNKYIILDEEDYEKIKKHSWCLDKQPNKNIFYVKNSSLGKIYNFLMNPPKGMLVDHFNHNTLDNRKCNLRICTRSQNGMNQFPMKNKTSKYKGATWNKSTNKWHSKIKLNRKTIHLGRWKTQRQAAKAYNCAASILFGEFAYLNKI